MDCGAMAEGTELMERLERLELAMTRRFDTVDRHLVAIVERIELLEDKVDRPRACGTTPTGC
jgi:hypothetical protein